MYLRRPGIGWGIAPFRRAANEVDLRIMEVTFFSKKSNIIWCVSWKDHIRERDHVREWSTKALILKTRRRHGNTVALGKRWARAPAPIVPAWWGRRRSSRVLLSHHSSDLPNGGRSGVQKRVLWGDIINRYRWTPWDEQVFCICKRDVSVSPSLGRELFLAITVIVSLRQFVISMVHIGGVFKPAGLGQ